ncbi:hypothetical protein ACIQUB_07215 [Rhizobium sp. NPDC090275]|uniref:hypothetical protein n=1 Tax=Rhizobium sp. NPDC090275 TaxID=3364498 RepID=UPI00383B5E30
MAENIKSGENAGSGLDWRAEASEALDASDPEKGERRRGRGRPKGSTNRKTQDFAAWYEAQGLKDPLQLQAEFMSADPVGVQAFFIEHERTYKAIGKQMGLAVPSLGEIVKEQLACARDLAPYLHGKAPVRLVVEDERLPFLVINADTNQIDQARTIAAAKGLTVGAPLDATFNEINSLGESATESPTAKVPRGGNSK